MNVAYQGILDVEDGEFTLNVERLALHGDNLSFHLTGAEGDNEGSFDIDGVANKAEDGTFKTLALPLIYKNFPGKYSASIIFSEFRENSKGCKVVGRWIQDNGSSEFRGALHKFSTK